MANILGISAFYHDSAACLVRDGGSVAAAQEERFTRKKHDHRFPSCAVEYCLEEAGITADRAGRRGLLRQALAQVRAPAGDLPRLRSGRPAVVPQGDAAVAEAEALDGRIDPEDRSASRATCSTPSTTSRMRPRPSIPSPFERAAILTIDGVGEWATASWGVGHDNIVDIRFELHFPHTLGPALLGLHLLHRLPRSTPASTR